MSFRLGLSQCTRQHRSDRRTPRQGRTPCSRKSRMRGSRGRILLGESGGGREREGRMEGERGKDGGREGGGEEGRERV